MARFDRLTVLNAMVEIGLVPVFFEADVEVAFSIVAACAAAGARVVEFTNRGDYAAETFLHLSRLCVRDLPHVVLGAGTVLDSPTAALYIAYGANFVVGPTLVPDVARLCNRRKIAYLPGCATMTEIGQAEELGVEIVKVFPGSTLGGPGFVRAALAPAPWTRIMPTGGVEATKESIGAWFKAGVACVGMGSDLVRRDLVASRDFGGITQLVVQTLAWIGEARR
jgi:2-dehydro-3-deoxyphosphogluconate aldolase / (4S)-4-hydroxy-2-oxoglutarate aldolase